MQLQLKVIGLIHPDGLIASSYPNWIVVQIEGQRLLDVQSGFEYQRSKDGLIDWTGAEYELGSKSYAALMLAIGGGDENSQMASA